MKVLLCYLFLCILIIPSDVLEEVRSQFPDIRSEVQADLYIQKLENVPKSPASEAYIAAMFFMKSRFTTFPIRKYKYFKKGKLVLDKLVDKYPEMVEIRYIRYLLQHKVPKFLGYYEHRATDFEMISIKLTESDLPIQYKRKFLENMLQVSQNSVQRAQINELINRLT